MLERIKTAIILVLIVCFCLFATEHPAPMILLLTIGGAISASEWANFIPDFNQKIVFIVISFVLILGTFLYSDIAVMFWCLSAAVWFFAAIWVKQYPKATDSWFSKELLLYVGLVLVVATISSMYFLWQQSPWWLLYVMLLGWCADSGAYFAGKNFGKNKLAPNVSPKKTYEGLVGGFVLCVIVVLVIANKIELTEAQKIPFIVLSVFCAGISVLGDLLESMVKRRAGVKDSGTILPGHGGLLDRIDSMMATLPFFALGFMLLKL